MISSLTSSLKLRSANKLEKGEQHWNDYNKIMNAACLSGYLWRCKRLDKADMADKWKYLKFALVGRMLYWFSIKGNPQGDAAPGKTDVELKGKMDLKAQAGMISLRLLPKPDRYKCSFQVGVKDTSLRPFLLASDTEKDILTWYSALIDMQVNGTEAALPEGPWTDKMAAEKTPRWSGAVPAAVNWNSTRSASVPGLPMSSYGEPTSAAQSPHSSQGSVPSPYGAPSSPNYNSNRRSLRHDWQEFTKVFPFRKSSTNIDNAPVTAGPISPAASPPVPLVALSSSSSSIPMYRRSSSAALGILPMTPPNGIAYTPPHYAMPERVAAPGPMPALADSPLTNSGGAVGTGENPPLSPPPVSVLNLRGTYGYTAAPAPLPASAVRFCVNCGAPKRMSTARFCAACGTKLCA
jgi:hypothetical protein